MSAAMGAGSWSIVLGLAAALSACAVAPAGERALVAQVDMTLNYEPNGRFNGCWKVGLPLVPGMAGDWKSRGWDQLVYEGTAEVKSMQRAFALTVGFADAAVGSGQIGNHAAFDVNKNIAASGTYKLSSGVVLDRHGKGGNEHTDFRNIQSFFFIIWQTNHSWSSAQFARDPSYYPISLKISVYAPVGPVGPVNKPPLASASGSPTNVNVGEQVALDGTASSDPDGGTLAFAWDFGDGKTASGEQVQHAWSAPGTYAVKLTVTDPAGATDTHTVQVTVKAAADTTPPEIAATQLAFTGTVDDPSVTEVRVMGNSVPVSGGRFSSSIQMTAAALAIAIAATDAVGNTEPRLLRVIP